MKTRSTLTDKTALHRGRKTLSSKLTAFAPSRITSAQVVVRVVVADGYVVSGVFFVLARTNHKSCKERIIAYRNCVA